MKKNKEQSFNQKLARLEEISEALDNDSIELEEAINLYEEGTQLAANCLDLLNNAELKITQLQKQAEKSAKNVRSEDKDEQDELK